MGWLEDWLSCILSGLVVLSCGLLAFLVSNLVDEEVMTNPEEMVWWMVASVYVYVGFSMWVWKVFGFDDIKLRLPDVELEEVVVCK